MIGRNVIQVIIQGHDQASPAFASAGAGAKKAGGLFSLAGVAIAGAALAIASATKKSIDAANALNKEMANVGTLIPEQAGRLLELRDAVQDLSVSTNRSTIDIAQGLYMTISALGDTAESMKILDTASRSATAGLATIPDAVRLITGVMKGYNDVSAVAAERVADLAFETVRLGVTTFPELADSMGRVIPLAAAIGVSQEELFASYATLTGVTGNAAMVSTQMSSIMRGLLKPTDDMKLALYKLGHATVEDMIATRGLNGGMRALIATTDGTSNSLAKLWENARGYPALFALTREQADTFDFKLTEVTNSMGALDRAFEAQTEGINKHKVALERWQKASGVMHETIGEELVPVLGEMAEVLLPVVELMTKFVKLAAKIKEIREKTEPSEIINKKMLEGAVWLLEKFNKMTDVAPKKKPSLDPSTLDMPVGQQLTDATNLTAAEKASRAAKQHLFDLKQENAMLEQITLQATKNVEERQKLLKIEADIAGYNERQAEAVLAARTFSFDMITDKETEQPLEQSGTYKAMEDTQAMLESMTLTSADAAHIMSDNFAMFADSVVMGSASVEEAFSQMMKSIFSQFISTVIKMMAFKALFKIFGGPLGGLVPMNEGGEVIGAANGLEVIGGTPGRDSVPALIGGGEAVVPSPLMSRMRNFLDRADAGFAGGGGGSVNLFTLFSTGTEVERVVIGDYLARIGEGYAPDVIEGTL